jgi:hypothetical protein
MNARGDLRRGARCLGIALTIAGCSATGTPSSSSTGEGGSGGAGTVGSSTGSHGSGTVGSSSGGGGASSGGSSGGGVTGGGPSSGGASSGGSVAGASSSGSTGEEGSSGSGTSSGGTASSSGMSSGGLSGGATAGSSGGIAASYFGLHINKAGNTSHTGTPWPTFATIGSLRMHDDGVEWADVETCDASDAGVDAGADDPGNPCYTWGRLDHVLSEAWDAGATLLYPFYKTPTWLSVQGKCCVAAGNPDATCVGAANTSCGYVSIDGAGVCDPPYDLLPDGGGSNQHFKDYVTALQRHLQALGGGGIAAYEIWNEPDVTSEWDKNVGTPEELVRFAQDARAIVRQYDPTALFTTPACTADSNVPPTLTPYCQKYLDAGGGLFADAVAFHGYVDVYGSCPADCPVPENELPLVQSVKTLAQTFGLGNEPLFDTEDSWGSHAQMSDWSERVAYMGRLYLLSMSAGVSRLYWYGDDFALDAGGVIGTGELWAPTNAAPDDCVVPMNGDAGYVCQSGIALAELEDWTLGATVGPCGPVDAGSLVWSCAVSRPGRAALALWDTDGGTTFPVNGYQDYRLLDGGVVPLSGPSNVPLGAAPILLEP